MAKRKISPKALGEYIDRVGLSEAEKVTGLSIHTLMRMKTPSYDRELHAGTVRKLKKTGIPIDTLAPLGGNQGEDDGDDAA